MVISRKDLTSLLELALEKDNPDKVTRITFRRYALIAKRIQKKVKGETIVTGVTITWESLK